MHEKKIKFIIQILNNILKKPKICKKAGLDLQTDPCIQDARAGAHDLSLQATIIWAPKPTIKAGVVRRFKLYIMASKNRSKNF